MHNLCPGYNGYFVYGPIVQRHGWLGKRLTGIHITNHPIHLIIKILLYWGHSLWTFPWNKIPSYFLPIWRVLSHRSSPSFHVTNFPITFHPSHWRFSQTLGHSLGVDVKSHVWSCLLSNKVNDQVHCVTFCPQGPFPFTVPFRMSPKGATVLQLFTCGWCLHIAQNYL